MQKLFDKILNLNREVWTIILAFIAIFALTTLLVIMTRDRNENEKENTSPIEYGSEPFIKATTVQEEDIVDHSSVTDCWIIYREGVYDLSDIITKQKVISRSQCGKTIDTELDVKSVNLITPYLIAYTYNSQSPTK